jgi:hypothetical protein
MIIAGLFAFAAVWVYEDAASGFDEPISEQKKSLNIGKGIAA